LRALNYDGGEQYGRAFLMSNPDKPKAVITRWWWVRHAPVRNDGGNIYGQTDIACDTSDREVFEAVAKILPRGAVWVASNLKRTHQTAEAIWDAGFPRPGDMAKYGEFAEQNLGRWQGMNRAAFIASRPAGSSWFADINEPAPGGESFMDLYNRVVATVDRITQAQAGRDIIAVGHGGTIKAAVGLAMGGLVEKGLSFDVDNCSVTRLDHFASPEFTGWRLPFVNQQPWIADEKHAAMHQPAGPEVAKLA
jgi:alpha-ribazole phosphatase